MALRKMAQLLTSMELESDFLSCTLAGSAPKSDLKDPTKIEEKERLGWVIQELYTNLVEQKTETFAIPVDDANCLVFSFMQE
mmetsp:Transcript_31761/g.48731  ORF Transcript_31761/g.48731 Transcript_31761/m.48731 type:complete len:82 (-) Transcript_31761:199-444(-)